MDPGRSSRRPFKRQRVDSYPRGSVLRVDVSNFMTYKRASVEPGPKLNLVLGPNGTGKSSLVCAICVGLAGKTTLLGRAEDVSSFVRRGADAGWVEITLSSGDPMRPHVVRREIHRDANSSVWYLNREKVRMKDVEELVRDRLKVQLDNLCQFLPQDKVVEFARMKPVDLLEATEKAIGNGELYEQHKQLIQVRKELAAHDTHKAALEESVAQLKAENSRNTRDVENIQRRDQLVEEVQLAKQKLPWVEYQERLEMYEEDKKMRELAKRELLQRQAEQAECEGPLAERQHLLTKLKVQKQHIDAAIKAADQKLVGRAGGRGRDAQPGLEEEMNVVLEEIQAKQEQIKGLAKAAVAYECKLEELAEEAGHLEAAVAALPPAGETGVLGMQRGQLLREQGDVGTQVSGLNMQLEELRTDQEAVERRRRIAAEKLRRIDDSKMRRLQTLNQNHQGIYAVWQWLQANKGRFRGPVYGPIAVEVECPDQQHLQYLEQQVAGNVWSFFVTQFHEDQDLLKAECNRLGFPPSIACFTGNVNAPIPHPKGEASEYARYGISQTLDSVFTAPAIIKRVLCDEARIHEVYVGDRFTRVEELLRDQERIQIVYTPDCNYRRTRSYYNCEAESTMVTDVRPARILSGAATVDDGKERDAAQADMQRCSEKMDELSQQVADLQEQRKEKQAHQNRLKQQIAQVDNEIKATHKKHTTLRTKLTAKASELERMRERADPRKKEPKLQRELRQASDTAFSKALELAEVQAAQAELLMAAAACDLSIREANMQVDKIREVGQQRAAELRDWEVKVERLMTLCKQSAEEARKLKQHAEQVSPMTKELEQRWMVANGGEGLPDGQGELRDFIATKEAEADGMLVQNPAALRQYNERSTQIANQERELGELEERRSLARTTIDNVTSRWLPELQRIVTRVSATFSHNFRSVGCAGDVVLHEAPEEDFEKYAIEIRVKFRDNEDLQTLDANRQSGGERSVSTILYLIALQGVTVTPFRVVDEINQGMDPINERKVFIQLVHAACRAGTPQCFLLTPKLLPDLPFTRDVTVLQIMNGSYVKDVAESFKMEGLLGSHRLALLAAA